MNLEQEIIQLARAAREAGHVLARVPVDQLDRALEAIAATLERRSQEIYSANAVDVAEAEKNKLSRAMVDRLRINEKTLTEMVSGVHQVKALANPLNTVLRDWEQPNGLHIRKVRVPIGVIGIIF